MPPRRHHRPIVLGAGIILLAGLAAGAVVQARSHRGGAAAGAAVAVGLGVPLAFYHLLRRQAQLQETQRGLAGALEQAPSAVVIFNAAGRVEQVNQRGCELLGEGRRELLGRDWRSLAPTALPPRVDDLQAAVEAGRGWSGEWEAQRPAGPPGPLRATFAPVRREDGTLACYVATFDDLGESRRTNRLLSEAQQRAVAGEEAKRQFLSTMSHEVRTPLNAILGFTSLLRETPLTADQAEYVEAIQLSGEALIQLTDGILDLARLESGRFDLDPTPCAPRECLEDALDVVAAKAAAKGIELLHWVDDAVPAVLQADGNRLRQVLVNLLTNAVTFTAQGEVEARIGTAPAAGAGAGLALVFSIRDTGVGISPEQQARLFRPFSQLDQALTRRHGGTGLGLAICKNIIELMGGRISLQSTPGQGSTFSFTLPVAAEGLVRELRPVPSLARLSLAIAVAGAPLRDELLRLGRRLGARLVPATPETLGATPGWDVALVDVSPALAAQLASRPAPLPGLPPERMIGLVPLLLPSAQRAALRAHFRLLFNKPVHHDALRDLLTTLGGASELTEPRREPLNLNVLLIDDDPVHLRLMQKQLANLGCRWTKAENSRVALQELGRAPFDVVLMDLHMPDGDGLTAIRQIRAGAAGGACRDVWIAALTVDARQTLKEQVLASGGNDYVVKPVTIPELRIALHKFTAARAASPPPP